MSEHAVTVEHDHAAGRFAAWVDGRRCELDYALDGRTMRVLHTGVPRALQGRGIAAELVRQALDEARRQGWQVQPLCSYVRSYMRRHPDTHDLLAAP